MSPARRRHQGFSRRRPRRRTTVSSDRGLTKGDGFDEEGASGRGAACARSGPGRARGPDEGGRQLADVPRLDRRGSRTRRTSRASSSRTTTRASSPSRSTSRNRPSLTSDMEIDLSLDTDANTATGDPSAIGADYAIVLVQGSVGLFKWNGTDYSDAPSQSSLVYSYDASGATIKVKASDLGGTKRVQLLRRSPARASTSTRAATPTTRTRPSTSRPTSGTGRTRYKVLTTLELSVSTFQTVARRAEGGRHARRLAGRDRERHRRPGRGAAPRSPAARRVGGAAVAVEVARGRERRRDVRLEAAEVGEGQEAQRHGRP